MLYLVIIGGALGSGLRYILGQLLSSYWSTLIVNVLGSVVLAVVFAICEKKHGNLFYTQAYLLLGCGFCGGFTTFSTFTLDNMHLLLTGNYLNCLFNIIANIVLSIFISIVAYKLAYKFIYL